MHDRELSGQADIFCQSKMLKTGENMFAKHCLGTIFFRALLFKSMFWWKMLIFCNIYKFQWKRTKTILIIWLSTGSFSLHHMKIKIGQNQTKFSASDMMPGGPNCSIKSPQICWPSLMLLIAYFLHYWKNLIKFGLTICLDVIK